MPLKTAVQMDPIEHIDIKGDSTFALLLEAQSRGHEIFYYTPENLNMRDGKVYATGCDLKVQDTQGKHFEYGARQTKNLADIDVLHLRQDPPFDMFYITTTHILERIHPETLVINNPAEVRNAPEKLLVTEFLDLTPPTLITKSLQDAIDFRKEHEDIIVKPLYGNGGAGVFRIQPGDSNLSSLVELFQGIFREPFIVQKYLADVRQGDKRIILVDGEIAGAINRVPAENETRSNMHIGGTPVQLDLTDRDREICARIGPELKKRELLFVGIDIIGDQLTEINVTSPTGIREAKRLSGEDIASHLWDVIEEKHHNKNK
ncbi:MAG: glutathione synthase [Pseudomonadota bacterium]